MGHSHHITAQKNLRFALFLNLFFAIAELIGGILVNSMAIISDAVHDFGDALALGMALYLNKVSQKQSDNTFSYGYKRFSPLGAAINAVILSIGSVIIVIEAVPRIWSPQEVISEGMFFIGVGGIIVNAVAFFRLHKGSSLNERTVALHLLEDVFGWAAVIIGSVVIYFTNWSIVDPVLSILIAGFIMYNAIKNLIKSMRIFLQAVPDNMDVQKTLEEVNQIHDIDSIHDVRTWALDDNYNVLTMHVRLAKDVSQERIQEIKQIIRNDLDSKGVSHVTIEIEFCEENCSEHSGITISPEAHDQKLQT